MRPGCVPGASPDGGRPRPAATMGPCPQTSARPTAAAERRRLPAAVRPAPQPRPTARSPASPAASAATPASTRSIFRILFVVLAVFGGSGLLLYALGWLLVPEDGETESEGQRLFNGRVDGARLATVLAIVVVLVVGLAATGSAARQRAGLRRPRRPVVVVRPSSSCSLATTAARPVAPAARPSPPAGAGRPSRVPTARRRAPPTRRPPRYTARRPTPPPSYAPTAPLPPPPGGPRYPTYGPPPPPPPAARSGRSSAGSPLASPLIVVGAADRLERGHRLRRAGPGRDRRGAGRRRHRSAGRRRSSAGPAGWSCVGVVLVVARLGRPRSPTSSVRGGVGDRTWDAADRRPSCARRTGSGSARPTLDLSALDLAPTGRQRVEVRQGIGDLLIVVPADVIVLVDADVRAGEMPWPDVEDAFLDGRSEQLIDGTDLSERFTVPESSAPSSAVLVIDAELGVGSHGGAPCDVMTSICSPSSPGWSSSGRRRAPARRRQRPRLRRAVDRPGRAGGPRRRRPGRHPAPEATTARRRRPTPTRHDDRPRCRRRTSEAAAAG